MKHILETDRLIKPGDKKRLEEAAEPASNPIIGKGLQSFLATLPDWLIAARAPDRICASLINTVPEFRTGHLQLHKCAVRQIRLKADRWVGIYELWASSADHNVPYKIELQGTIYPPGSIPTRAAFVTGSFATDTWRAMFPELNLELRLKQDDTELAALKLLTDPEPSRRLLNEWIRTGPSTYHDIQIHSCHPKVVRYKLGSRCTIRYQLDYGPTPIGQLNYPDIVIAKTYRRTKGLNAYRSMLALWNSPLRNSTTVRIAEPLAYNPKMRVLVQGPLREQLTLAELLQAGFADDAPQKTGELEYILRKTAAGLVELHFSKIQFGEVWQWQDLCSEINQQILELADIFVEFGPMVSPLLEKLNSLASAYHADALVPSHGTFRPAQVLLYEGEIGFIDFDSFCLSEPANDLALFLATVLRIGLTPLDDDEQADEKAVGSITALDFSARFERLSALCNKFLNEYQRFAPVSRERVLLWEALYIFTFVLAAWRKIKIKEVGNAVDLLRNFLSAHALFESQ